MAYSLVMFDEQNRIVMRAENVTVAKFEYSPPEYATWIGVDRPVIEVPDHSILTVRMEEDDTGSHYYSYAYDD